MEGAGAVGLSDLVRQALRMRPDRLVVGECRGAEVVDLLAALNTGHDGGCGHPARQQPRPTYRPGWRRSGCSAGCPGRRCTPRSPPRSRCWCRSVEAAQGRLLESICLLLAEGPDRLVTVVPAWMRGHGVGPAGHSLATLLRDRGVPVPPLLREPGSSSTGTA